MGNTNFKNSEWEVTPGFSEPGDLWVHENGHGICEVAQYKPGDDKDVAVFLQSAPDMYRALLRLNEYLADCELDNRHVNIKSMRNIITIAIKTAVPCKP